VALARTPVAGTPPHAEILFFHAVRPKILLRRGIGYSYNSKV
jgi:hypothetical protein